MGTRITRRHQQAASPRIALAYDFSHFDAAGLPLESTLRAIVPHARFVHLKVSRLARSPFVLYYRVKVAPIIAGISSC
jgi:hypothetical protein